MTSQEGKSTIRQAVIKGKTEYCHLILEPKPKIVFTIDGKISSHQTTILGKENGFFSWMQFVVIIMFILSLLTYYYVGLYYALIPSIITAYLLYVIYSSWDMTTVHVIDKQDVIEVNLVKRTYLSATGFDIRFKDSKGNRKVRRFLLANQGAGKEEFYEKAKELFRNNGYM
ncbi:hypothetical protein MODO_1963 [Myroides odoratimimus]|uniref:YokE-like PH domain-containing protein n=1 Tax=Myroides odoratimimus CCUG 10230 TaxID=883150 RepID=A0ABN0E989_9FLAO|nr:hypothetical protein [Myroides odoratimimus]EHO08689.1 hypothetical protein HMPREF9712_02351 [Myroides odoratimimus CCUG 10230]GAQ14283.1 hypothetical protein MODO_1963 [Myroides odoratimimus]STZ48222.1 Uncharacterised protein [Myroides odoratimimus]